MQGTAADLIKLAMIAVQDWLDRERLATKLLLQVHDELVLEVPRRGAGARAARAARADDRRRERYACRWSWTSAFGANWDQAH